MYWLYQCLIIVSFYLSFQSMPNCQCSNYWCFATSAKFFNCLKDNSHQMTTSAKKKHGSKSKVRNGLNQHLCDTVSTKTVHPSCQSSREHHKPVFIVRLSCRNRLYSRPTHKDSHSNLVWKAKSKNPWAVENVVSHVSPFFLHLDRFAFRESQRKGCL